MQICKVLQNNKVTSSIIISQNVLNGQQSVAKMIKCPFWHLASHVLLLPLNTLRKEISLVVDFFDVLVSFNYQLVQIFVTDKQLFDQNGK